MYNTNVKRTNITTNTEGMTTTTSETSSSSTRVRARARETLLQMAIETIRRDHMDVLGRPMPRFTEAQLTADLEEGTPSLYYRYALSEAASAPLPSWRYVLAIVARLKRQQVPEDDLLFWL